MSFGEWRNPEVSRAVIDRLRMLVLWTARQLRHIWPGFWHGEQKRTILFTAVNEWILYTVLKTSVGHTKCVARCLSVFEVCFQMYWNSANHADCMKRSSVYAAVLIGRITGLARPSVRPSVRLIRLITPKQKGVENQTWRERSPGQS